MPRKLKVFRTPIGFHDAYVAAPSQKAALAAWGSERNLFAQGAAEAVDDVALMREPLAHPGKVIRVSRGSDAEHLAAAARSSGARDRTSRRGARSTGDAAEPGEVPKDKPEKAPTKKPIKPKPRPSRTAMEEADAALERAEQNRAAGVEDLRKRADELARERRQFEQKQDRLIAKLKGKRDRAVQTYERRLAAWRDGAG